MPLPERLVYKEIGMGRGGKDSQARYFTTERYLMGTVCVFHSLFFFTKIKDVLGYSVPLLPPVDGT